MTNGLIFFAFIKLIVYLLKEDKILTDEKLPNSIQYLVNNKNIRMPHIHHCKELLGLANNKIITEEDIKHAYSQVYVKVAEHRVTTVVFIDVAELRAAKCYLLDRWVYLAHDN